MFFFIILKILSEMGYIPLYIPNSFVPINSLQSFM